SRYATHLLFSRSLWMFSSRPLLLLFQLGLCQTRFKVFSLFCDSTTRFAFGKLQHPFWFTVITWKSNEHLQCSNFQARYPHRWCYPLFLETPCACGLVAKSTRRISN